MTLAVRPRTLYVSDLDRTLLRSDGTVSAESARLLNAAIEAGALFTYATARSFLRSRKATDVLRLNLPVITYGGTVTADPDSGVHSDLRLLDQSAVDAALGHCAGYASTEPILHTFEDGRDWVRWRPERVTAGVQGLLDARPGDPRLRPATKDDPVDTAAVFYVAILAQNEALIALRAALRPSLAGAVHFLSVDPGTPGLDWLEFHNPEGTKAKAIQRVMTQVGAERLVVFGDNHNDLPMFEIADEAHAVGNAIPEVKDAATSVLDSNDHDAVARWIASGYEKICPHNRIALTSCER